MIKPFAQFSPGHARRGRHGRRPRRALGSQAPKDGFPAAPDTNRRAGPISPAAADNDELGAMVANR
jgi:hypothetical protein